MVSAYIDDLYVDKNIMAATTAREKLAHFVLVCKDPGQLEDGARVLGLEVWENVFSLCRKLVGHLHVCSWLWAAASVIKWQATVVMKG